MCSSDLGKQTDEGQNPIAWNNRIARIDHDNRLLGKASLLERNIHKVESANMQRSRGSSVVISKFRCSVVSAGNVGRTLMPLAIDGSYYPQSIS